MIRTQFIASIILIFFTVSAYSQPQQPPGDTAPIPGLLILAASGAALGGIRAYKKSKQDI